MLRRTARRDRLIGLFLLGLVLFNPPVLNLFSGAVYGWPVLWLYLIGAWAAMIGLLALIVERGGAAEPIPREPLRK